MLQPTAQIIGREAELASVEAFLESVRDGPAALRLEGEPGIGKTTIWLETVERARRRGWRTLASRPASGETQLPFSGLGDLLEDTEATMERLPGPQRRALRVALLIDEAGDVAQDWRAIAVGVRGVLEALSTSSPVLVAVDDAQWLDDSSAAVLEYACRRIHASQIGLLVASRTDPTTHERYDPRRLVDVGRAATVALTPFDVGNLHRLVRARLATTLPSPDLRRLHEASGGNPFFALEIGRNLGSTGPGLDDELPLPTSLRDLIAERIGDLPDAVRDVLLIVASVGDPTLAMVRRVALEADSIDAAIVAGVVAVGDDRIRFTHPLFAAEVLRSAGPEQRRDLHRRLVGAATDPVERGRHLALSVAGPDERVASELEVAARRACARGAPAAGADLAERAARLGAASPGLRTRRSLLAATAYRTAGDLGRARSITEQLVGELPAGPERADALTLLADMLGHGQAAIGHLRTAADEAAGDPVRLARIHRLLGGLLIADTALDDGLRSARTAADLADRAGDTALAAICFSDLARYEFWLGRPSGDALARATALAEVAPELAPRDSPGTTLGLEQLCEDRLADARITLTGELGRAERLGDEESRLFLLFHITEIECRAGALKVADRRAVQMREAAEQIGLDVFGAIAAYAVALVAVLRGDLSEARSAAAAAARHADRSGDPLYANHAASVLGLVALTEGDHATADGHLRPRLAWLRAMDHAEPAAYGLWPDAIEAMIGAGDLKPAGAELATLERRAVRYRGRWARPRAARCRGLLHASEGRIDSAITTLRSAVAAHADDPNPIERGRTLLALGVTERRARRKRAARESLATARALFDATGAAGWLSRAEAELARIGGRQASGERLTATEAEVAALVATGRTNREVAAALFMTPRTVEWHLSKIYSKLGVRSRAELASRSGAVEERQNRND